MLVPLVLVACAPSPEPPPEVSAPTDSTASTGSVPEAAFAGCEPANETFDALWAAFDRDYALFDVRLPDARWDDLGRDGCAALGEAPSDDRLFDVLLDLLRHLDDGHVNLIAPDLGRSRDAWVSEYPDYDALYALELNAERHYLDGPLSWAARDWFAWGRTGDVGYVSLTSFDGLSPGGSERGDREAAGAAMDEVLAALGDARAMVVDVRANEGGWDSVALDVAARFAGERAVAWSEQRRDGPAHDDFSDPVAVEVAASGPGAFAGPVVLLTSGGTFSAAETFVLAMRVRDDVTVIGERTSGHFSDLFDGRLPNGWRYTLSGERYTAADGEIYEGVGAPVDVEVALDADALRDGRDAMLEVALSDERFPVGSSDDAVVEGRSPDLLPSRVALGEPQASLASAQPP